MGMHLGLYTNPDRGSMLIDPMPRPIGLKFRTNEHGFADLTCFLPMSLERAFWLYDRPGLPFVCLWWNGFIVYEGRLEDVKIVAGGVQLTAFGYWRALTDEHYTALWSATKVEDWRPVLEDDLSGRDPKMYAMDNQARLFIGLNKGTVYANNDNVGAYYFIVPDSGRRDIKKITFDYSYDLPSNWTVGVRAYDDAFGSAQSSDITTTGGTASGSFSWDLSATPRAIIAIQIFNSSGSPYTFSGETGSKKLHVDNVRVQTTASSTIDPAEIAADLVAYANSVNADQLQSSGLLIQATGLDLSDEVYEDLLPAEVLTHLSALGDSATPPNRWEAAVWENRMLCFRPKGSAGRTWYVDVSVPEIERTIEQLVNAARSKYQDAAGRTRRTAVTEDAFSEARYGLVRGQVLTVQTTDAAQAESYRDLSLNDLKSPPPRVRLKTDRIYDASGARWPTFMVRASDKIIMRNFPPTASVNIDRIRSFRLAETNYDVDTNTIELTPETPLPTLDFLIARQSEGLK